MAEPERTCWICFASERENRLAAWVRPCRCRGTTKWVHQSCLYRWIDEKQKGNMRRSVVCQQCQTEYIIMFPRMGYLAALFDMLETVIKHFSPYVASGMFVGAIYWTAMTYGAITVMQVMGPQRGIQLLENGDLSLWLIGLPIIPVVLVLIRLLRWEEAVLRLIRSRRQIARKLPLINWMLSEQLDPDDASLTTPAPFPATSAARIFCGAVFLPTISVLVGRLLYKTVEDPLHRTLLGGLTYIGVKGLLKIYLRQKQYLHKKSRRIVDYTEENVRNYVGVDRSNLEGAARQNGGYDFLDQLDEFNGAMEQIPLMLQSRW